MIYASYESEANKKAIIYTVIICSLLLLLFWLIKWNTKTASAPVVQDIIEINLGTSEELPEGEQKSKAGIPIADENNIANNSSNAEGASSNQTSGNNINTDNSADASAAYVQKNIKTNITSPLKNNTEQKPKITMNGIGGGKIGNDEGQDNGYKYTGGNSNGNTPTNGNGGDSFNGDEAGNAGGGSPTILKGNRKIIKTYSFTGELKKATIYAKVKVSASGVGIFSDFDNEYKSTDRNPAYKQAIVNYLSHIQFDKSTEDSFITMKFEFKY
ncbi:MAG: hypothetical protein FGM46_07965 [Ferruginibacter sp.]|nr:hypothetical protein [Ferruginibacter sp.]